MNRTSVPARPRLAPSAAALLLVAGSAEAQTAAQPRAPERIPRGIPVRAAGTYHLSTATWTRGSTAATSLGNDSVYVNDVFTGYWVGLVSGDTVVDEGEIPGPDHPTHGPGTNRDSYVINGFTFAYCSDVDAASFGVKLGFYDSYAPCGDPATLGISPERQLDLSGILPGGGTSFGCWIVTFDLTNTTAEFQLESSGEGTHDGSIPLDDFGWSMEYGGGGSNGFASGPLVAGDPNYYAFGAGCYYTTQGPIPSTGVGTGLGTQDEYFGQGPGFPPTMTCYFFGGYTNTVGPAAPTTPYASFLLALYSDGDDVHDFLRFCDGEQVANASTGEGTRMVLESQDSTGALLGFDRSISANAAPNRLQMIAVDAPGPGNGGTTNIGYFLMGTGQNTFTPPGSAGPICVAPGIRRYLPPVNVTSESITFHHPVTAGATTVVGGGFSRAALGSGAHPVGAEIGGALGFRWSFQAWHRDGANASNLSDAIGVDFTP